MDNQKTMVLASFVADSLALGAHWIYDTEVIQKSFGRVDGLLEPAPDSYHAGKQMGEFTHYGDQALVLLQSMAANKGFDLQDFSSRWQALFGDYRGYVDQATRTTLDGYASGKGAENAGSPSQDLAGAARVAPIVYFCRHDLGALVDASRAQTRMTHNNEITVDSAEFFARLAWEVLNDLAPVEAMQKVSREHFQDHPISEWVRAGIESKATDSLSAISRFGQSCYTEQAFPGVVQLIARHENDPTEALIQAVMAGGDSAARGMIVGMVLGANSRAASLPGEWLSQLGKKAHILELLERSA